MYTLRIHLTTLVFFSSTLFVGLQSFGAEPTWRAPEFEKEDSRTTAQDDHTTTSTFPTARPAKQWNVDPACQSSSLSRLLEGKWRPRFSNYNKEAALNHLRKFSLSQIPFWDESNKLPTERAIHLGIDIYYSNGTASLSGLNLAFNCTETKDEKSTKLGSYILSSLFLERIISSDADAPSVRWQAVGELSRDRSSKVFFYSQLIDEVPVQNGFATISVRLSEEGGIIEEISANTITKESWQNFTDSFSKLGHKPDLSRSFAVNKAFTDFCKSRMHSDRKIEGKNVCCNLTPIDVSPYEFSCDDEKTYKINATIHGPTYVQTDEFIKKTWSVYIFYVDKRISPDRSNESIYLIDAKNGKILSKSIPNSPHLSQYKGHNEEYTDLNNSCSLNDEEKDCHLIWRSERKYNVLTTFGQRYGQTAGIPRLEIKPQEIVAEAYHAPFKLKSSGVPNLVSPIFSDFGGKPNSDGNILFGFEEDGIDDNIKYRQRSAVDAIQWTKLLAEFFAENEQLCVLESTRGHNTESHARCAKLKVATSHHTSGTRALHEKSTMLFAASNKLEAQSNSGFAAEISAKSDASDPVIVSHEFIHLILRTLNRINGGQNFHQCLRDIKKKGEELGAIDESLADTLGTLVAAQIVEGGVATLASRWALHSIGGITRGNPRHMNIAFNKNFENVSEYEKFIDSVIRFDEKCGSNVSDTTIIYKHAAIPNYVAYLLMSNPPKKYARSLDTWYRILYRIYFDAIKGKRIYTNQWSSMSINDFANFMYEEANQQHAFHDREAIVARVVWAWWQVNICPRPDICELFRNDYPYLFNDKMDIFLEQ